MPGILRSGVALAVVVGLLGGCAPMPAATPTAKPTVTTTPRPTTIAEPPPEPAPTFSEPAPTGPPPLDTLVLSPAGLGPIHIGETPGDDAATSPVVWDPDYCDGVGNWVANYPPNPNATSGGWPFSVAGFAGSVDAIAVQHQVGIRTDRGIGIGSTRDAVLAAYPDAIASEFGYALTEGAGTLTIIVLGDEYAGFGVPLHEVLAMQVWSQPREPKYFTDGIGSC